MKNGNGAAPGGDCAVGAGNRVLLRSDWEGAELVDYLDPGDFELPGRFSIPLIVEKATNLVIERLESVLVLTTDLVRGQPTDSISHQLLELITIELQRARESALDARAIVALAHDRLHDAGTYPDQGAHLVNRPRPEEEGEANDDADDGTNEPVVVPGQTEHVKTSGPFDNVEEGEFG